MKEIKKEEFKKDIENYSKVLFRKPIKEASDQEKFQAVAYAVKDTVVDQWMATHKTYEEISLSISRGMRQSRKLLRNWA